MTCLPTRRQPFWAIPFEALLHQLRRVVDAQVEARVERAVDEALAKREQR